MKNLRYCSSSTSTFIIIFIHINIIVSPYLTYTEGFDNSVIQLPHSGLSRTRTRSKRVLSVGDYGAKGDGLHNDTKAFLEAWKIACSLSGFINVVFPSGKTFLVHPIDIAGPCRSKITLRILGTIVAPQDPVVWHGLNQRKWLYFHGVNHLTIDGGGRINGMGQEWWARSCKINSTNPCHPAPTALTFHRCKNLIVRNLMLLNSQQMHMAFTSCMRVVASHLKVSAPAFSPNTDGIHISATKGVEVRDSVIRTGDDCISIVRNSSRVWIRNIFCGPGHGISIGSLGKSKAWEKVQDINVNGAYLFNTDNGVRIKTWQGGNGFASKITFQNILMENVSNPIIIDQYYCDSRDPCKNQPNSIEAKICCKNVMSCIIRECRLRLSKWGIYPSLISKELQPRKKQLNLLAVMPLHVKDYIWKIFFLDHAWEKIQDLTAGKLMVLLGVWCILLPVFQAVMISLDRKSGYSQTLLFIPSEQKVFCTE